MSGGLDSSVIGALINGVEGVPLETYSVRFDNPAFDETDEQHRFTYVSDEIRLFGQDPRDGLALKQWIGAHYRTVYETGPPNVTVYQRGIVRKE